MPTLVNSYTSNITNWNTANAASVTFTPAIGEILVLKLIVADSGGVDSAATPTVTGGGGPAVTSRVSDFTVSHVAAYIWTTAAVTAATSTTVSVLATAGAVSTNVSFTVERWSNAKLATTPATCDARGIGAPSTPLTTAAAGSYVSWANGDWAAVDGASRTYNTTSATPAENNYAFIIGQYTAYSATQAASAAGSQTLGLTAPTGQTWTLVGIEIQDAGGGPGWAMPNRPVRQRGARRARYRRWQWSAVPSGMQVIATQTANNGNGILLQVKVITGQAGSPIGGSAASAAGVQTVSVTTTVAGSLVYGAANDNRDTTIMGFLANTTALDNIHDAGFNADFATWKSAAVTGTPGATSFGTNDGTQTAFRILAGLEILPGTTLAEDPSSPLAPALDRTAGPATSVMFNAPPGSLIVAMVSAQGTGANVLTFSVTDTYGLSWTEQIKANPSGSGYAGVWTAVMPGGAAGPQAGVATLAALAAITAPAVQQLAPATLLAAASLTSPARQLAPATLQAAAVVNAPAVTQLAPATLAAGMVIAAPVSTQLAPATLAAAWSIAAPAVLIENVITTLAAAWSLTSPAVQLAPAALQAAFAVNSPAAVQLAPAVLAAAFTVTGPASALGVPATLAAAWSIAAPAVLLAPATLAAAFTVGSPNSALAAPASMIITGSLTGSAGQGANLAAGFAVTSPAQQLAPAALTALATISSPAVQDAPTILAAGLAVAAPDVTLRAPAGLAAVTSLTGAGSVFTPAQGVALLQPGWALTAAGIMVPLQVISGMRAGEAHTAWAAGEAHTAWQTGEAHASWAAGEAHETRYAAGEPHTAWSAGEAHT